MRVQFEFTDEDCIEVTKRILQRSNLLAWKWKGLLLGAVFSWLTGALVFIVIFSFSPLNGLIIGLFLAGVSSLFYPASHRRVVEKNLRKHHWKHHEAEKSYICEVELTDTGLWTRQMNRQTTYEWQSVEEIVVTDDSVDFFTRNRGGVVVRKRAFKSLEEQGQFVELAKRYLELSRQAHAAE